jgi:hypothetical protein
LDEGLAKQGKKHGHDKDKSKDKSKGKKHRDDEGGRS